MRASRLLSILLTLQAKGHVTAQELAEECEVSLRTIYRDIDALSSAGIPVYSERGSDGGYRLLDGYKTRLNGLSAQEADSLFFAGLPGPAADLGLGSIMAGARLTLLTALPEDLRHSAEQMQHRFHLDTPAWFSEADSLPEYLPRIAQAVWEQRQIDISYQSWKARNRRRVSPLGLVLKSGAWYLVGAVEGSPRTYRVSRILDFALRENRFERPKNFNLAAYWDESTRRLEEELHPGRATLRLSPTGRKMFDHLMSPYVRAGADFAHEDRQVEEAVKDPAGWIRVSIPVGSLREACVELLRFGAELEVLAPPDLRTAMSDIVRAMTQIYEGRNDGSESGFFLGCTTENAES
jgi:predicted DNA-binding transcriptional regulator YafY